MLPDLSSPFSCFAVLRGIWMRLLSLVLVLFLGMGLSACDAAVKPPRAVVKEALAMQIQLTQTSIASSLDLEPSGSAEVGRVRVEQVESIPVGADQIVRLTGHFDWQLPEDRVRMDSPFELYLEQGDQGQSWRLAQPVGSEDGMAQDWVTYPLAIEAS
ncbi:MAG: Uncharacterised protein [Prochlorococcus marinus str. MIT 9215]|nr:MAG: Uncharacterised protein [Prochlorococcus marinus str. MIT 9215]